MIIETHPPQYNGYPFISLIQFNEHHLLAIIDNCDKKSVKAFVLDCCEAERVKEINIINVALEWYGDGNPNYPLSIQFSRNGLISESSKIYRSYSIDSISRVIGPVFTFEMDQTYKVKRKRKISVDNVIEIQSAVKSF
jgi:hypothetical protein